MTAKIKCYFRETNDKRITSVTRDRGMVSKLEYEAVLLPKGTDRRWEDPPFPIPDPTIIDYTASLKERNASSESWDIRLWSFDD